MTDVEDMPRRALQVAAALGDRDARNELRNMKTHTLWAVVTVCSAAVLCTAIIFGAQACSDDSQAAKELRLRYIDKCRLTPEEVTKVVPK